MAMAALRSFAARPRCSRLAPHRLGIEQLEKRTVPSFIAAPFVSVGSGPESVAVGSFTSDGHADLVVANLTSNTVSILLGNGDGSFQSAQSYPAGFLPDAVALGDFNGDGHADLAIADDGLGVSVLLGNGDG